MEIPMRRLSIRNLSTRSISTWNILIDKYIHAHHKDEKYITRDRAHSDLLELYQELYQCHTSDSLILAIIHKIIHSYYNDVMKSIQREKAVATLSMS
jgi:hypothetical protein